MADREYIIFDCADMKQDGAFMLQLQVFATEVRKAVNKPPLTAVVVESTSPVYSQVVALLAEKARTETVIKGLRGRYELHERAQHLLELDREDKARGVATELTYLTKTQRTYLQDLVARKIQCGTPVMRTRVAEIEIKMLGCSREKEMKP